MGATKLKQSSKMSSAKLPDDVWAKMSEEEKKAHIAAKRAANPKKAKPKAEKEFSDEVWAAMSEEDKKAHIKKKRAERPKKEKKPRPRRPRSLPTTCGRRCPRRRRRSTSRRTAPPSRRSRSPRPRSFQTMFGRR